MEGQAGMLKRGRYALFVFWLAIGMEAIAADMTEPLPVRNTYPPMMRFFDPLPESAIRPYSEQWQFELNQHYSSIFFFDSLPNGRLLVDMEIYTVESLLRKSISDGVELTLRLPVHYTSGGFLDGPIQNFHNTLGLPNGGRERRPMDGYNYRFSNGWHDPSAGWEMGNVVLSSRIRLSEGDDSDLAGLVAVKVPTASLSRGWGSGAADIGAGIVWSKAAENWFAHLDGWLIHPTAKRVPAMGYGLYARGALSLGWHYSEEYTLIAQLQGGTSPYADKVARLNDAPLLVSFGLRGKTGNGTNWAVAFVEDFTYYTTQDFSLMLSLSWD